MNPVLLHGSREDKDVVDVNKHGAVQHVPEDIVDQGLEDSGGVDESEGYNQVLKVAQRCVERGLPLVSLPDADQVVCVTAIKLGEDHGSVEGNEGGTNKGQGIIVLHSDIVQSTVVDAGTKRAIVLPHKEEPRSNR